MILSSRDVCRCPSRKHPDRSYFGMKSCAGCWKLIVSGMRVKELDALVSRVTISEPSAWASNGKRTRLRGAE